MDQFNPQMMSMMSAQLGIAPEQIAQMIAGSPEDMMMQLLKQQEADPDTEADDDSELKRALSGLRFRPEAAHATTVIEADDMVEEAEVVGESSEPPTEDLSPEAVEMLVDELRAADDLFHHLAAVLGACPRCFGTDGACDICAGKGAPGHSDSAEPTILAAWLAGLSSRIVPKSESAAAPQTHHETIARRL